MSAPKQSPVTRQRKAAENGADATVVSLVPQSPPAGRYAVPGSPGWRYTPGEGVWRERWQVLRWCPRVTRHLVDYTPRGTIGRLEVTVEVGDHRDTVMVRDLGDAKAGVWARFPDAVGVAGRDVHDALANLTRDQAARLPLTPRRPRWIDGRLVLPPVDVLPRGYGATAGGPKDFAALLRTAATAPRVALLCGAAIAGLYVEPLGRQSAVWHAAGAGRMGKSTAAFASAAMLGFPADSTEAIGSGVILPWNTTGLGPGTWLGSLSILPGWRDELTAAGYSPAQLGKLVLQITQGGERDASSRSGEYREAQTSWRGFLVSTGNYSILDQCAGLDGIPSRVVEVATPITPTPASAGAIEDAARAGYGHGLAVIVERGPTPAAFGATASKVAGELCVAVGGIERSIGRHISMAVAGARVLGELVGVPEFGAAALVAGRAVLGELVDALRERGIGPGDRLVTALAGAMAMEPGRFPTREQHDKAAKDAHQFGRPAPSMWGFDLVSDVEVPGEVAVVPAALRSIAAGAGMEDVGVALRELRAAGRLIPQGPGDLQRVVKINRDGDRARPVKMYVLTRVHPVDHPSVTGPEAPVTGPVTDVVTDVVTGPDQARYGSYGSPDEEVYMCVRETGDTQMTIDETGSAASVPTDGCSRCRTPGEPWCGLGAVAVELAPCVACGEPTQVRSACGAARTAGCKTLAESPVEPLGTAGGTSMPPKTVSALSVAPEAVSDRSEIEDWARAVRKDAAERDDEPEPTDADIETALALWRETTRGLRWVEWAGTTGISAYFATYERRQRSTKAVVVERIESDLVDRMTADLRLHHDFLLPGLSVTPGSVVAQSDVNFQYCAAASSTKLGDGEPTHLARPPRGGVEGLVDRVGYAVLARELDTGHPALGTLAAGEVLTMPTVKYLIKDRGVAVPVAELVLWPEERTGYRLKAWALRLSKARLALLDVEGMPAVYALRMLKAVATTTLGGMLRSVKRNDSELRRFDWSDMVMTTAAVNAWRAVDKADTTPGQPRLMGMRRDAAWWLGTGEPLVPNGLVFDRAGGKWKLDRWAEVDASIVDAYDSESPETFNSALLDANRLRRAGE